MKKSFPAFYSGQPDYDEFWDTAAFFSFDANVLLNIYGFSQETQKTWLKALKYVNSRTFITYQAAYEYHKNLAKKWRDIEKLEANAVKTFFDSLLKGCEAKFEDTHMKTSLTEAANVIHQYIDSQRKNTDEKLAAWKKDQEQERIALKNELADILTENSIGQNPDVSTLRAYYQAASVRFEHKIPPGLTDKDKSQGNPFGDALIWFELKEARKPFIFVTFETKTDWFVKPDGKLKTSTLLQNEMLRDTQTDFECAPANDFLKWYEKKAGIDNKASAETAKASEVAKGTSRLWSTSDSLRIYLGEKAARRYDSLTEFDKLRLSSNVARIFVMRQLRLRRTENVEANISAY